jgi:cystathionine beta-lyase
MKEGSTAVDDLSHGSNSRDPEPVTEFDEFVERRGSDSGKWSYYDEDVLPLWVADMDVVSPKPVLDALHRRIDHGVFGYGCDPVGLREVIRARFARLYAWEINSEDIVFLPGLVCGLNVVTRATGDPGSSVLVNTPVYPPFLSAPVNQDRVTITADLAATTRHASDGRPYLHYEIDFDALEAAVTPDTRLFILCNPHNPVGRAYTPAELAQIAEFCARHDLLICSDEIHCDLLLAGSKHYPIAGLAPEVAARTVTLMAPSKTYNLPGLGCSMAIVPNSELRRKLERSAAGIVPHVNVLGLVAAEAAYAEGDAWLAGLLTHLTTNRNLLFDFVRARLPQLGITVPEATYLAWLDFRSLELEDPYRFLLREAKVALGNGKSFGDAGAGFLRLNFGCCRATLLQGLEKIEAALALAGV